MFRILALLFCSLVLTGCVAGQNIKLQYQPDSVAVTKLVVSDGFALSVSDKRSFVTSGNKNPWYIGHYRAGFGNTWDVTTYKKVPLADQLQADLKKELMSLGLKEGASETARLVAVTIRDWNFDAMNNGRFWYDIQIVVSGRDGDVLAESSVKEEKVIKGSMMTGAKSAMEKQVPLIYGEIIRKLVRENPAILAALSGVKH